MNATVLETNNHPGSRSGENVFDWCHPAQSNDSSWRDHWPFIAGAALVTGLLTWQVYELIHLLAFEERDAGRIGYSLANIFVCSLISAGLFLLHRLWAENRGLRRNLHVAEGLQELQTAIRNANRELELQSRTDFLTGVGNSLLLFETLEIETKRCDRYGEDLSVALIEFGGLRRLHFTLGRMAVDQAIRTRVTLLQQTIGSSDWLFRWSDGEFVVIWLNAKPDSAIVKSKQIFERLQDKLNSDGLDIPVSIGVTTYDPGEGCDRLLARVDLAKKGLFKGGFRYLSPGEAEKAVPDA